jgi:hypothetical protein
MAPVLAIRAKTSLCDGLVDRRLGAAAFGLLAGRDFFEEADGARRARGAFVFVIVLVELLVLPIVWFLSFLFFLSFFCIQGRKKNRWTNKQKKFPS